MSNRVDGIVIRGGKILYQTIYYLVENDETG